MPCMHLWRLSLRSDFPKLLALLVSCHLIPLPLSCSIQPVQCWGDKKGSANTLVHYHVSGGISEASISCAYYEVA